MLVVHPVVKSYRDSRSYVQGWALAIQNILHIFDCVHIDTEPGKWLARDCNPCVTSPFSPTLSLLEWPHATPPSPHCMIGRHAALASPGKIRASALSQNRKLVAALKVPCDRAHVSLYTSWSELHYIVVNFSFFRTSQGYQGIFSRTSTYKPIFKVEKFDSTTHLQQVLFLF